jgi:ribosomal protein S12 methylthiotransferase
VNIGFISLGCSKNRVDTEIMMAKIKESGHNIVNSLDKAEIAVINTCGFINDAKEESINTIIETGKVKAGGVLKHIIATGCLTQRYGKELFDELPELDAVVGISYINEIDNVLKKVIGENRCLLVGPPPTSFVEKGPRVLTTPAGSAYLKITEGCNNRCSYCAIPLIRGSLRSRPIDEIVFEAGELVQQGVKELVLIGQDTAAYGRDLYSDYKLAELLERVSDIEGLEWIRLMYLHPVNINDNTINAIFNLEKVIPYLDIPVQHASSYILKKMNRKHDLNHLHKLLDKLRKGIDGLVLRTTVMVGFPGETEEEFQMLYDFVKETEFDWLGVFAFTPEENTPAESMDNQVPESIKQDRCDSILKLQSKITRKKNVGRINQEQKVLISSRVSKNLYLGRGYYQAPEVDGITMVKTDSKLVKGELVNVQLKAVRNYDMIGELKNEYT